MKCVFSCCERVSRLDPQLAGIVRFGLKLIRHMWKASLPDVGLNKSVRHEPKRTMPATQAYKTYVRGVSPQCGIEQIREA